MTLRALIASRKAPLPEQAWRLARSLLLAALLVTIPVHGALAAEKATTSSQLAVPTEADLLPGVKQPYIVKEGDTLWDIARHFFKNPHKWMKIWEQNLYITNPDLIYPGNEIRFSAHVAHKAPKTGGLVVVKRKPEIIVGPPHRIEDVVDTSMVITALTRQDFISPAVLNGAGYVLDSPDERINYGANDRIYMRMSAPVEDGTVLDVFRTAEPIRDPASGKVAGLLVKHLGQVRVTGHSKGITEGLVLRAFEEISRGDRLKPARSIDTRIQPDYPKQKLAGAVMYIRNNATEAGQHQIVGIDLGAADGVKTGSMLKVMQAGRTVRDIVTGKPVTLPEETVGQLIVLAPQAHASIALVTRSTSPINIGDAVHNLERP